MKTAFERNETWKIKLRDITYCVSRHRRHRLILQTLCNKNKNIKRLPILNLSSLDHVCMYYNICCDTYSGNINRCLLEAIFMQIRLRAKKKKKMRNDKGTRTSVPVDSSREKLRLPIFATTGRTPGANGHPSQNGSVYT